MGNKDGKEKLLTVKLSVPFGLKPRTLSNKKINFYRMGKVKWGEDVSVKCIKHRQSEKGKRYFK